MNLTALTEMARDATAVRERARLQPVGGPGDKVFPATYEGGHYAAETRVVDGTDVGCVLLDAVQSQANRFEAALQDALDRGRLRLPVIRVVFPEDIARELGPITSLTAPHRCYDAILRDSDLDGTRFPKSGIGRALSAARPANATALLRWCPTALIFGAWDSTGARGGMGAKFARAVTSEIVGIGSRPGVRTSSRIDPLGIRAQVPVAVSSDDRSDWRLAEEGEKGAKKPSEVNHGNVLPTIDEIGGVTIDWAEQTWVLSAVALRRYRFPIDGSNDEERDLLGRTALFALALAARALARDDGLFLRSRCHLVPVPGESRLEVVAPNGGVEVLDDLDADAALRLLAEAVEAAQATGLSWVEEPVELVAQPRLVDLVRKSLELTPGVGQE